MKFGRTILKDVEGYVPGEQPSDASVIKLNTNENPYPPSPNVIHALRGYTPERVRKYPNPVSFALREECARRYGYAGPEWVIAGNGMDELLALTVRTFADPGDTLVSVYPTYILYETLALLHGAKITLVDLDEGFLPTDELFAAQGRVCFFPRPNSPTGVCPPRSMMERLCREFPGIVVIDEAYVDFADDNCMDFARRFENCIVMRTFSKSFSLAGMRLGIAVANPEIIAEFMKTKDSYNVNGVTQAAGLAAMQDYDHMLLNVRRIRQTRTRTAEALVARGFTVAPSQSNFLLARWSGTPGARQIFEQLKARRIFVRYFNARRLDDGLRITIGTDEEMDALLHALDVILGQ